MNNIVTNLNDTSAYKREENEYPHILLEETTDALAILVSCLEDGDVPLYIKYKGTIYRLDKKINKSPLNLSKILKVYPMTICITKDEMYRVTNTLELMDLEVLWKED